MIVVPPMEITDSILTSSTVAEPHAPSNYAGGTTYDADDFVTDSATLKVYMSLAAGNVGNTPAVSPLYWQAVGYKEVAYNAGTTYAASTATAAVIVYYQHRLYESLAGSNTGNNPYTSPTFWEDIGPTMKWAMFDTLRNTATRGPSPLTVVVTPGTRIDTAAVLGVEADSVQLSMTSSAVTVYDETINLSARPVSNWYDYFFKAFRSDAAYLFQNIPPYTNGILTAVFTKATGAAACGALVVGSKVELGTTQKNPNDDALNFSTIERDSFGNSVLIQRRTVPKTMQTVWADSSLVADIRAARLSLNAVPAVWAGLTDNDSDYFPSLLILGIYKQWTISLAMASQVIQTIELEEV